MARRRTTTTMLVMAAFIAAAAGASTGRSTELAVRGRSNANASVAADGPFVVVAWGGTVDGGATDVFIATSHEGTDSRQPDASQ
jgi:hypothetical protein